MVSVQAVFLPVHAPVQPVKAKPAAGFAVNVTDVPGAYVCEHVLVFRLVLAHVPAEPTTEPAPVTEISRLFDVPPPPVANVAVTLFAFVIETAHVVLVPEQAPLHPVKVAPKLGEAVSVMPAPAACGTLQPAPPAVVQVIPPPEIVPLPTTWPVSTYVVLPPAKSASTLLGPVIVNVHVVVVNEEHAPSQCVKSLAEPDAGIAVSVMVVLAWTLTVHPVPPAAVQWTEVFEGLAT
jgi:hypothetical protein